MKRYRVCGLTVASDIDLSTAASELRLNDAEADVRIRRSAVPTGLAEPIKTGPTWQRTEHQILITVPGVARFLMSAGRELAFEPESGQSDADLLIFLIGSAFGALLHQRGALVLHAGAVAVNGEAVLFCGPSGSGKSSLVAALSATGYPLITDDVCIVQDNADGVPVISPDGRRLKLWADTIEGLSLNCVPSDAVRAGIQKYWVHPPTPPLENAVRLRAIYFLRAEEPPHSAGIEPLGRLEAVALLRNNAYRPQLVKILDQEATWMSRSLAIMPVGRAFYLTRKIGFDALPSCIGSLESHWRHMEAEQVRTRA